MGMGVDQARGYDLSVGIDRFFGIFANFADFRDFAAGNADVGPKSRHSGAVDNRAVANDQVITHDSSLSWRGVEEDSGATRDVASQPFRYLREYNSGHIRYFKSAANRQERQECRSMGASRVLPAKGVS
jgi:hypothetical protein